MTTYKYLHVSKDMLDFRKGSSEIGMEKLLHFHIPTHQGTSLGKNNEAMP